MRLWFKSLEVRFEVVDSKNSKKRKTVVLLFKSFEARFDVKGKHFTVAQFRRRAAQILKSYSVAAPGKQNYLQSLVAGMPRRLAKCKLNRYAGGMV